MWHGKRSLALLGVLAAAAASPPGAWAIKDKDNHGRWTNPTVHDAPDREVPGFLVNLGPTGARATAAKKRIVDSVMAPLAPLAELETRGDGYALERGLSALRRKLAGIPAFDEKDAAWKAAFKADPAKSAIRAGAVFRQLREAAARAPHKALTKEVETFAGNEGDSFYGRMAKDLSKGLPK